MAIKPTTSKEVIKPTKWEVVYEDEDSISIWRYNSKITTAGPVEVEYKWKRHYNPWNQKKKTLGELAKEEKKRKKLEKSQLGINYSS